MPHPTSSGRSWSNRELVPLYTMCLPRESRFHLRWMPKIEPCLQSSSLWARSQLRRVPSACRRGRRRAGGLLAYGPNLLDTFRQGGVMVGKVLSGVKPAELPIELPIRFELVVNLRTAKALGISVPTAVLLRANEVIE